MVYRLLDNPVVFNLAQFILAPGSRYFLNKYFGPIFKDSHGIVLDIGCGPRALVGSSKAFLIGVDLSLDYIRQYQMAANQKGVVALSHKLCFKTHSIDECRCFGLLHHLPQDQVTQTIRAMIDCTRPGGRIVIYDSVWPRYPLLRPFAWLSHFFDRGRWMLTEERLFALTQKAHPGPWQSHRFTYSLLGHEAVVLTLNK